MANDTDLDPLGDGSLLQSYTFNGTYNNLQGTGAFTGSATWADNGVSNGGTSSCFTVAPSSDIVTNIGHGITGDIDASFVFWVRPEYYDDGRDFIYNFAFGDLGERYNVEVVLEQDGDSAYFLGDWYLHKRGATNAFTTPSFDYDKWIMVTYTYESSTQTNRLYLNDTLEGTINSFQMKFLDAKPIRVDGGAINSGIDQIMVFTKTLTIANIQELMTMNAIPVTVFPSVLNVNISIKTPYVFYGQVLVINPVIQLDVIAPAPVIIIPQSPSETLDPFLDGSGLYLWRYENNMDEESGLQWDSLSGTFNYLDAKYGKGVSPGTNSLSARSVLPAIGTDYTLTYWMHTNTADSVSGIYGGCYISDNPYIGLRLANPDIRGYDYLVNTGSATLTGVHGVIADGWNFCTLTRAADGTMVARINGTIADSSSTSSEVGTGRVYISLTDGVLVDQYRMFNRVLTVAEQEQVRSEVYSNAIHCSVAEVFINFPEVKTITSPEQELDPFNDGHGLHLWRYENNFIDEGGAEILSGGTGTFTANGAYGTACTETTTKYDMDGDIGSVYTITMWYYTDVASASSGRFGGYLHISTSPIVAFRLLYPPDSSNNAFYLYMNSQSYQYPASAVLMDDWNFIVLQRRADGHFYIYANGTEILHITQSQNSDNNFMHEISAGGYYDQMRLFDRVLTTDEMGYVENETYPKPPHIVTPSLLDLSIFFPNVAFPESILTPDAIQLQILALQTSLDIGETPTTDYSQIVDFYGDGSGMHLWHFDDENINDVGNGTIDIAGTNTYPLGRFLKGVNTTVESRTIFSDMDSLNGLTYTFWAKLDYNAVGGEKLVVFGDSSDASNISLEYDAEGQLSLKFRNAGGSINNDNVVKGKWVHYAVTQHTDNRVFVFVNGNNENTYHDYGTIKPSQEMRLQPESNVLTDSIRMFNRVLSDDEILEVMAEQIAPRSIYISSQTTYVIITSPEHEIVLMLPELTSFDIVQEIDNRKNEISEITVIQEVEILPSQTTIKRINE